MRQRQSEVAREARRRAWVRFVDTWAMFADASDSYAMYLPEADGRMERMRADDGVHLTRPATNRVARRVYESMAAVWDLTPPPTLTPTVTLSGFYDAGWARINRDPIDAIADNRVSIRGYGLGLFWGKARSYQFQASLAWRDTPPVPGDTSDKRPRVFAQGVMFF